MNKIEEEIQIRKMSQEDHKKRHKLGDNWRDFNT